MMSQCATPGCTAKPTWSACSCDSTWLARHGWPGNFIGTGLPETHEQCVSAGLKVETAGELVPTEQSSFSMPLFTGVVKGSSNMGPGPGGCCCIAPAEKGASAQCEDALLSMVC